MSRPEAPSLLPAYPGLDAGQFGHWGKYSQNQHVDNQWNRMDLGPVQSHWRLMKGTLVVEPVK